MRHEQVKGSEGAEPTIRVNPGFEQQWPGASALATECLVNLVALVDRIERTVGRWGRRFDIPSVAALNVMDILRGAEGPLLPSIIAERMLVTRPTLTGILQSLEKRGLVGRETHPADGRMALVHITRKGRRRAQRFLELLHRIDKHIMQVLSEDEQRNFLRMLASLQANLPSQNVLDVLRLEKELRAKT